ncbi:G-type lectin S-receptor-like serine/threonine-protein kinase At2g19130 [Triticum dicoccoides]|uniref:G-type lectin S-receptor-like serine/threonine-protein kinase At2g19130 n=1 Tax=Triticum dicoccoides TaxID=85692 RepID=UPI001890F9AB|nr:G-type lectin S-receptor-like serine/threonine-protein kinase At2g19130 [Triticum dicoccoides]
MPLLYILVLGLLLSHTPRRCSSAPASDTLTEDQVLAVGDKLVSTNGKFALGFFQPAASTVSKSQNSTCSSWYLGIWFNKIPVFTVVWVANREEPIPHPNINSTKLKFSSDGDLVIVTNPSDAVTESLVWSTHIVNRTQVSSINTTTSSAGVLLNSGNLALLTNSKVMLWQSFDYPTDITLSGAKLGWNKVTGFSRKFISKKSLIDMGLGSYSLELDTSGVAVLKRRNNPSVVYWHWASSKTSSMSVIPTLKTIIDLDPRTKGLMNPIYFDNDQEQYYMYTSPEESSSSLFVSLDISGQVKLNVWSHADQSWQTICAEPADACTPAATCGPFTVCNGNAQPSCDCMESFSQKSPQDWEFEDRTGGCIRNTPLHCSTSGNNKNMTSSTGIFHPISQVVLPYNPQSIDVATTQSKCEEACLSSCSCTAYSYNNSRCSVWHGELFSVNLNDGIDNNSKDALYLRLAAAAKSEKKKNQTNIRVVTAASIIGFGLLVLMLLALIWRNKFKPLYNNQGSGGGIMAFRYTDLVRATKNFSEKLGGGGFGSVYKGVLSDSTSIAVKRLDGARQGEKQFRAEVSSVGLIQHINIVKLIGFCCEGDHRLLVYEHMLNGSLDGHLFESNAAGGTAVLDWNTRYQIALGVAKGLSYLHESCHKCIIHCDIKPGNILVDASFVPKIADFGLAAFVGRDFSRVMTSFRGTAGYLAPEWLSGVAITPKIDVYGFGMVLLEIISGRRNSSLETPYNTRSSSTRYQNADYFPVQAISKLHGGDVKSLVDPQLHGDFNLEEAERVCKVACWCIQDNEFDRPTMCEVVRVLEGLQEINMPPMLRLLAALTEQFSVVTSV